jgi:23S rRNA U2552 (ribose-2'-O)-methylase RlmE/FtsJ
MNMNEGLREGDLTTLIDSIISIDEYESKLEDDAIVVAFKILYKQPAQDLNRFIQKSSVDLIDTDMSPAPDVDGKYVVFIEMTRDEKFSERLLDILDSLKGISDIKEWQFSCYDQTGVHNLTLENLHEFIRLEPEQTEETLDVVEFLQFSNLDHIKVNENQIILTKNNKRLIVELVDFGYIDDLLSRNACLDQAIRLDEKAQKITSHLRYFLGNDWLVECLNTYTVLTNPLAEQIMIIRV